MCIFLTAGGTFCLCCSRKCEDEVLETASVAAAEASDSIITPVVIHWFSRFRFSKENVFHPKRTNSYRKDEIIMPEQHFNLCRLNFQLPKDILYITTPVVFSSIILNVLPTKLLLCISWKKSPLRFT